jgi:hypothetical protein
MTGKHILVTVGDLRLADNEAPASGKHIVTTTGELLDAV